MPAERIQKVLANAGVASRRASEALIAAGRVTIDGRTAKIGEQVDPMTAAIEVDGMPVGIGAARAYIAVHKPAGVTSTVRDRHAARTVLDLLPSALVPDGARLYPVGRLDQDSEGLLLLTNDGDWAERVLHPRFGITREYAVALAAPLTADQLAALGAGIALEEGVARLATPLRRATPPETAQLADTVDPPPDPGLVWYRASLGQGWKRQLRRMFGAVGAPILRLVRVRVGGVQLGTLRSGRAKRVHPEDATRTDAAALARRTRPKQPGRGGPKRSAPSSRGRRPAG